MMYRCTECGGEIKLSLVNWYCEGCDETWGLISDRGVTA